MCQISSLMAAAEGPVAEFLSFANFEEKKRKSNLLMPFPKTGNQMGSFGQIRKKIVFPLLSADSRYFRIYALNSTTSVTLIQKAVTALQAATILVAMASEKKFWRPKFWRKSLIGDQQIKRETYMKNYQ